MVNANMFTPLFDPSTDTFDQMRNEYPLCLTVILAVALRTDYQSSEAQKIASSCFHEARVMCMKTLFASSATMDSVQGMLLLATNLDNNWFAVSHAYQMGLDMKLQSLLRNEIETDDTECLWKSKHWTRRLRTALLLHQVEQEIGSGTARNARGAPVKKEFLRRFPSRIAHSASDMRISSTVEIVQLRGMLVSRDRPSTIFNTDDSANVERH